MNEENLNKIKELIVKLDPNNEVFNTTNEILKDCSRDLIKKEK